MLFTWLGKIAAWLAVLLGSLRIGMGLFVASIDDPEQYAFAVKRYLGSASSSGEAIDRGINVIVIGIALGVLTEISSTLSKRRNRQQD
jgi:hypothetical protein